jgi:hypothetical protein
MSSLASGECGGVTAFHSNFTARRHHRPILPWRYYPYAPARDYHEANMHGVASRAGFDSPHSPQQITQPVNPSVLVITADLGFYSGVLLAACSHRWHAHWARNLTRAIEIVRSERPPIVIYDANLPWMDWQLAFDRLSESCSEQRILLATNWMSEELWREVLTRHGYDLLPRGARSAELARAMRFAWLSLR